MQDGADFFAQSAIDAGGRVYVRIEKAFLVRLHGNGTLWAGVGTGVAPTAFGFIFYVDHRRISFVLKLKKFVDS